MVIYVYNIFYSDARLCIHNTDTHIYSIYMYIYSIYIFYYNIYYAHEKVLKLEHNASLFD